jgi:hypothetical protein
MAELGGLDTSSYPKSGAGNRLMTPAEQTQSAVAPLQVMQGITHLQQSQFDLAHKQLSATNQIFGAIAANPTPETITQAAASLRNLGVPANTIATEMGNISGFMNDPAKVKEWAFNHIARNMSVAEQLQASGMGAPEMMTDNQRKFPVTVQSGLAPGIGRAGGSPIPVLQSPTELATPRTIQDPTGRTTQTTQQGYQEAVGQPAKVVNGGGAAPVKPGTMPGVQAAPLGNDQGQAALAADLAAAAPKIANTRDLAKAVQLADSLGPNATGPSSETEQRIKEFLVTRGLIDPKASGVVARQELGKYLQRYATNSPVAQRSDMGTLASKASNPNIDQALPAIAELAKNAIASDRMDAAMPNAFPKDTAPADYLRHKGTFMQKQDQAAYRFDFLPQAEQRKLYADRKADLNSNDPAKKEAAEKFMRSLLTAHQTILRPE